MAGKHYTRLRRPPFIDDSSDASSENESADETFYFGSRTKSEVMSGQKRQLSANFINRLVFHALTEGYSALVPPSLDTFFGLLSAVDMPVSNKSLNERCVKIVVNAVASHVSQAKWCGHLVEEFNGDTMRHSLLISKALADAVTASNGDFSYKTLQTQKMRSLMEKHAENDYAYVELSRSVTPDDPSWEALSRDAVNRLIISPDCLRSVRQGGASLAGANNASGVVVGHGNAPAVWGPPKPLTQADAQKTSTSYFLQYRSFMVELVHKYNSLPPGSPEQRTLKRHLMQMVKYNQYQLAYSDDVDYKSWVKDAFRTGLMTQ